MLNRGVGLRLLTFIVVLLGLCWLFPESAGAGEAPSTLTLSPELAFNPIGTEHTLTATLDPATSGAKVFFQVGGTCSGGNNDGTACFPGGSECTGGGTCVGPDLSPPEFSCTTTCDNDNCDPPSAGDGTCEGSYTNTEGIGVNKIRACARTELLAVGITDYADCADGPGILSSDPASVTKYWLGTYVTSGWNFGKGSKPTHTGAGTFGIDPSGSGNIIGSYGIKNHQTKVACVFDTFSNLQLECSGGGTPPCAGSPVSTVNKASVHMEGACTCGTIEGTLVVEDNGEPGKNKDKIGWTRKVGEGTTCTVAAFPDFGSPDPSTITGGNIQVHEGPKE